MGGRGQRGNAHICVSSSVASLIHLPSTHLALSIACTHCSLGGNDIGDAGAQALAEALKTNTTLATLE